MVENIIYIILIIILLFFISSEEKINNFFSKKYFKYLFVLLITYFIYEKYNFLYLMVLFLIITILNVDFDKFKNNKYLEKFISDSKGIFTKSDIKTKGGNFNIKKIIKDLNIKMPIKFKSELLEDDLENKNIEKFKDKSDDNDDKLEPFKDNVEDIKVLYDNIQNEISKLKEIVK